LTSARKSPGLGPFESSLERDLFILLEFDRMVLAWHPQPFTLPVPAQDGFRRSKYTPDVAVEYASVPDGKDLDHVDLCEVKYRDELKANWDILRRKFKTGFRYARHQGWRFRILTEREIRTPRLGNAKFFLTYRERATDIEDIYRLATALKREGTSTPSRLLSSPSLNDLDRGRTLAVLWHMVAVGKVQLDFDTELTMASPIKLDERADY